MGSKRRYIDTIENATPTGRRDGLLKRIRRQMAGPWNATLVFVALIALTVGMAWIVRFFFSDLRF